MEDYKRLSNLEATVVAHENSLNQLENSHIELRNDQAQLLNSVIAAFKELGFDFNKVANQSVPAVEEPVEVVEPVKPFVPDFTQRQGTVVNRFHKPSKDGETR